MNLNELLQGDDYRAVSEQLLAADRFAIAASAPTIIACMDEVLQSCVFEMNNAPYASKQTATAQRAPLVRYMIDGVDRITSEVDDALNNITAKGDN